MRYINITIHVNHLLIEMQSADIVWMSNIGDCMTAPVPGGGRGRGRQKKSNIYSAQFWSDLIYFLYNRLLDVYEDQVKK